MLEQLIEELEELKGKELTLIEMDNAIQDIIGAKGEHKNSIFDGEIEEFIEKGEYAYSVLADEEESEVRDICICFEVLEENEDNLEIVVKVTDVQLL